MRIYQVSVGRKIKEKVMSVQGKFYRYYEMVYHCRIIAGYLRELNKPQLMI